MPNSSLVIAKPRWGAGSQDTLLAHRDAIIPSPGFIVQEYAPGVAASVAFLAGRVPGNATKPTLVPLRPTLQKLSTDGRFRYLGGSLPLPAPLADRAVRLASQAIECLPPLCGCLGVDLVLGDVPDGSQDYVIEINPRFTTSYIGLRALAVDNLAEAMLRIVEGKEIPAIRWRAGRVDFDADGSVRRME